MYPFGTLVIFLTAAVPLMYWLLYGWASVLEPKRKVSEVCSILLFGQYLTTTYYLLPTTYYLLLLTTYYLLLATYYLLLTTCYYLLLLTTYYLMSEPTTV